MSPAELRLLHSARPFKPFDLHLADRRRVSVEHPEQLAITPNGRVIAVARPDDTIELIDMLMVVSLKPRPNGRHTRRRRG